MEKINASDISNWKKTKGKKKIVALTAYDFPFARLVDRAGIDIVLVGDSLGMVCLGYPTTVSVTMQEMIHHARAASRAVRCALVIADMPYGSYRTTQAAVNNGKRLIKKAGVGGVKVEGGERVLSQVKALIKNGIPVMGHVGMTPQTAAEKGGYRVQGKDKAQADAILEEAVMLDRLGAFSIVLECVPVVLADKITRKVKCPTIGLGAGPKTDGQVLVLQDMLGFQSNVRPKFVRRYATLDKEIRKAVSNYREDILQGRFPSKEESY